MTKILIADPDAAFRKALILLLNRKLGVECVAEAANIGTLIQILVDQPPDLLLLSWSLYGAPGLETCQLLKKSYPTMKVVLLSVNPDDAEPANAASAGFLLKGAPIEETLASLKTLVSSHSPG